MNACPASTEAKPPETLFCAEQFLAEAGLLRQWTVDGFKARLARAAKAEGFELGAIKQRGNCVVFKVLGDFYKRPRLTRRMRGRLDALLIRTGYQRHQRAVRFQVAQRQGAVQVWVVLDWRSRS